MMTIKNWFLVKNFNDQQRYIIQTSELVALGETEKALHISTRNSDFGNITFWCPKSCVENSEIAEVEEVAEIEQKNKFNEFFDSIIESRKGLEFNHPKFGKGIIKKEEMGVATVDFNGTIKQLASAFISKCLLG